MKPALVVVLALAAGCKPRSEPAPRNDPNGSGGSGAGSAGSATGSAAAPTHAAIGRADFNRWAVRLDLPIYWIADTNSDHSIDPDELATLLFYPTTGIWVDHGKLTADFERAYDQIIAASKAPAPTGDDAKRQALVAQDLDQGKPTLVRSELSALSADDKAFVGHMLTVAKLIDELYATQNGTAALAAKLPADPASRSLFRRNRGPKCVGPATEKDPACSAIPGAPQPSVTVYPAELQVTAGYRLDQTKTPRDFCKALETDKHAAALLTPFTVVDEVKSESAAKPPTRSAVSYSAAYTAQMSAIAAELTAAAGAITDPEEKPLLDYLHAAAASFTSNDWLPADEAWAKMTVDNSKWYVRVGPDEVYWEPCSHKAGFHLAFARINQGSKEWQGKLVPVQQDMEAAVAAHAGSPYAARRVTFHLPDFIDIIVNAGDDRTPLGATIGQSLPNWGPVANEGRGRTVAMVNFYTDPDSVAARRAQAESVLDAASLKSYTGEKEPGLLSTILHEATHNLGPAHEYKVSGKAAEAVFGGNLASVMEELKAQTGALFLLEFLRTRKIISDELAAQSYADAIVWAFGHISQGMYSGAGTSQPKTYGHVAAIQIGFLLDHGALTWDDATPAANGKDKGALTIHPDKLVAAVDDMMKTVAGIKARGDRKAAEALTARYVDGDVVPHKLISERFLRFPKASFVYAVSL